MHPRELTWRRYTTLKMMPTGGANGSKSPCHRVRVVCGVNRLLCAVSAFVLYPSVLSTGFRSRQRIIYSTLRFHLRICWTPRSIVRMVQRHGDEASTFFSVKGLVHLCNWLPLPQYRHSTPCRSHFSSRYPECHTAPRRTGAEHHAGELLSASVARWGGRPYGAPSRFVPQRTKCHRPPPILPSCAVFLSCPSTHSHLHPNQPIRAARRYPQSSPGRLRPPGGTLALSRRQRAL
ncbi:hypothetical protein B0H14DRAFT_2885429 [Mycena olivaceomarginata]|nr:hypothetical protein B0H14DRAFT_2885429 [Mycena olivaceomarginata]